MVTVLSRVSFSRTVPTRPLQLANGALQTLKELYFLTDILSRSNCASAGRCKWPRGREVLERCVGPWPERAGKGRLRQIREFPTVRAAERKLLCCWIIMRSRMGAGGGCAGRWCV